MILFLLIFSTYSSPSRCKSKTAWKVSKYGVISGPYFPVFGLNTGEYGSGITPYLDTFHAVEDLSFSRQKWPIFPKYFFFRNPLINLVSFIHVCLHSKKSNVNLSMTYWHWERAFLAITWELDFSQACSFRRMFKSHSYFHFTSFPDKNKELIFLKIKKKPFSESFLILVIFAQRGFF